jgi:hypothetical protein
MLRVLALLGLFFMLFLPLFLPKSRTKAQFSQNIGAKRPRFGIGKMGLLLLLPLLPKWLGKLLHWTQGPTCPRCREQVRRHDTTCSKCGNVLSSVQYRVEKTV